MVEEGRPTHADSSESSEEGRAVELDKLRSQSAALKELLPSRAVVMPFLFETIFDQQATMLQPVGGMDRIAHAIYEQVRPAVRLNTPVKAIRRIGDRVRVVSRRGEGVFPALVVRTIRPDTIFIPYH